MKQKVTEKVLIHALIAFVLSGLIVLSSTHAKDVVRTSIAADASVATYRASDSMAKVTGDLHNHIDKQTLKSISMDNPVTARGRELKALEDEKQSYTFMDMIEEFVLFYRFDFSLRFSLALA